MTVFHIQDGLDGISNMCCSLSPRATRKHAIMRAFVLRGLHSDATPRLPELLPTTVALEICTRSDSLLSR